MKVSRLTVISFLSTNGKNTVVDYRVTYQNKLIVNAIKFWLFLKEIQQKKHSCTPCTFIMLASISFEEIFDWSECALWLFDFFLEKLECYRRKTRPQWCLARTQDTLLTTGKWPQYIKFSKTVFPHWNVHILWWFTK